MIEKHLTATGAVLNGKGQVLMIRHRKLGVWLFPGGHVEENETPDDAVLREILEETGIRAEILPNGEEHALDDPAAVCLHSPRYTLLEDIGGKGEHFHIDLVYFCRPVSGHEERNLEETTGIGWFGAEEIRRMDTYQNVRHIALRALEMESGLL